MALHFHSFHDFLAMGGYAFYVWLAFAIAFLVLVLNIVLPLFKNKKLLAHVKVKKRARDGHET